MFKNKLKEFIKEGKAGIGTFVMCNSPDIVEVIALTGFDFIVIDTEHGPLSVESTQNLIRAAELRGITPITRVTECSETTILRSLDVGAHGIQVPQVNDRKTAEDVVRRAKYYPEGYRGIAMPRAANYGTVNPLDYFKIENEETMVVVHCENKIGLDNLEEIVKVPSIDVIFLGPFDMSQSLGIPGQVNHPLIEQAAERVLKVSKSAGKAAGIFVSTGEQAKLRREQGFQYITIGMDVTLFGIVCKNEIAKAKSNQIIMSPRIQTIVEEKQSGPNLLAKNEKGGIEFIMRKHYDKEFKAKVTLEAIKGEKTIQELATLYSVHPNLLALWKKQLEENAPELFERSQKDKEKEAAQHKEEELCKEIGQLQVENEF